METKLNIIIALLSIIIIQISLHGISNAGRWIYLRITSNISRLVKKVRYKADDFITYHRCRRLPLQGKIETLIQWTLKYTLYEPRTIDDITLVISSGDSDYPIPMWPFYGTMPKRHVLYLPKFRYVLPKGYYEKIDGKWTKLVTDPPIDKMY